MQRHVALLILAALVALFVPTRVSAQSTYGPDPRVTSGTLQNGLAYLVMPLEQGDDGAAPRGAAVRLIVDAGLIQEDQNQAGAADVAAEAARIRSGAGASVSIADDHAVISVNLDDPANLPARLSQLAGLAAAQPVPGDALAAAKAAAAERLSRMPVEQRVHNQALRRLSPDSRAVRRPAAGMTDSIRNLSADRVQEFASRWYVPSNMTVIVAAPGTPESLTAMVRSAFGGLNLVPKPAPPQNAAATWAPPATPVVIEDPDLREAVVALTAARPSPAGVSIRDFRSSLVQDVGLHIFESLVQTRLTKRKVPFTSVATDRVRTSDSLAWTAFHVTGDPANWRDVVVAAVTEANRIRLHGLTKTDVTDALVAMVSDLEAKANAEDAAGASALADMLVETRGGPSARQRLDLMLALVTSVSADAVEWEFNKSFDPSVTAVVLALPARPNLPGESDVAAAVREAWAGQPEPASELVRPWTLLPVLPTPGEVAEMSQDPATGVWSGWLSNGVRFHVRKMPGRTPGLVEVRATLAGSEMLEDESNRGISQVLAKAWEYPSTPAITEPQLNTLFQTTNTRMQVAATGDSIRFAVPADVSFFNAYMQRLHVILNGAIPSEQAVKYTTDGMIATAQGVGRDINATFMDLMAHTLYKDSEVRSYPVTEAQARAISYDAMRAWGQRLAAMPLEVSVVGDVSEQDAIEAIRFYVGSLPSRPRISQDTLSAVRTSDVLKPGPYHAVTQVQGPAGGAALDLRAFFIGSPTNIQEARALDVAANILNARLVSEAPRLGLPGGGQVAVNYLYDYPGTSFMFYVSQGDLDEQGVAHVNSTINDFFAKFAADGPTPDELAAATDDIANRNEQQLDYAPVWADFLAAMTFRGQSVDDFAGSPLIIRALTADQVRSTFAKYFNRPGNVIELAVLPAPPDELLQFIDQPPPSPPEEPEGDKSPDPAGPPSEPPPPGR